jgi:hypothetical protein
MKEATPTLPSPPSPFAGSDWFDPLEEAVRGQVRGFIEQLLEEELEAALGRGRYERGAISNGRRHGHRPRQLVTTFGPVTLSVPRARLHDEAGEQEWKSAFLPAYKRLSRRAEALIAEAYLAGMNTRRVRRALARLFAGHVGKDVVSRAWQRTRSAWEAWQKRDLADADIVRLILDGTVVKVRLDRKAAAISLLIVLGVRRDGQKVVLAIKNMGGESEAACASQLLQVNFSRTCSTTFHQRGTHSSVSVTSSPSLRTTPPHLGQAQGAGWTMRSRGKCSGSGRRAGLRLDVERGVGPAGCRDLRRRLLLGDGLLELSELELELGDDLRPTLGGLAVLLTARLGEQQLQALDLEPGAGDLGFSVLGPRFGRAPRRPLGEDHRMRGGEIGGQRIGAGHAPD